MKYQGEVIDEEYGIPRSYISCPSCGKTYKQQRIVCTNCEECKKCCRCDKPEFLSARIAIEEFFEFERLT